MAKQAQEHALIAHQNIGDSFTGTYYVENSFIKETVQGKEYQDLMLRDRSGSRNAKYWGVVSGINKGGFAFVACAVEEYMGKPSIIAKNLESADTPDDLSPYIPTYDDGEKNAESFDAAREILKELEKSAGNETAGLIVDEVYSNSKFFEKFMVAPGSARPHYGREGGLLANTVRVAQAAINSAESYNLTDFEKLILVSASLLFKIGGIDSYAFEDCMPIETKRGLLLGVNNLTMTRVSSALKRVVAKMGEDGKKPDQETVIRLLHAVSSYDGVCVKPMSKEALVLNAAYRIDSEMVEAVEFIENDVNENDDFTAHDPSTGHKYYTG